ncbi:MAG: hypothetical protein ABFR89_00750 [Actinomycetota bacterium]
MNEMNPTIAMTNTELEELFDDAGIAARVVGYCPDPACEICSPLSVQKAA